MYTEINQNILRYTADKEGVMKLISLSIGKYVIKENITVERPPALLTKGGWLLHINMTETEVQQLEKILQNKPNALNLLCSKIKFNRNKASAAKAAPQSPSTSPSQIELEAEEMEERRKREEYWRTENEKMQRQNQKDQLDLIKAREELGVLEKQLAKQTKADGA